MINFQAAYCEAFDVRPEDFAESVFLRCCRSQSKPLTWFLVKTCPSLFREDLKRIEGLKDASDGRQFGAELESFEKFHRHDLAPWRHRFGVRISVGKLSRLARLLHSQGTTLAD